MHLFNNRMFWSLPSSRQVILLYHQMAIVEVPFSQALHGSSPSTRLLRCGTALRPRVEPIRASGLERGRHVRRPTAHAYFSSYRFIIWGISLKRILSPPIDVVWKLFIPLLCLRGRDLRFIFRCFSRDLAIFRSKKWTPCKYHVLTPVVFISSHAHQVRSLSRYV